MMGMLAAFWRLFFGGVDKSDHYDPINVGIADKTWAFGGGVSRSIWSDFFFIKENMEQ